MCYLNWERHGFLDAQHTRDLKWTSSVLVRVNRNALLPLFSARWVVNEARRVEFATRTAVCVSSLIVCTWYKRVPCGLSRVLARMDERLFKARTEGCHRARERRTVLYRFVRTLPLSLYVAKKKPCCGLQHVQISIRHMQISWMQEEIFTVAISSCEEMAIMPRENFSR